MRLAGHHGARCISRVLPGQLPVSSKSALGLPARAPGLLSAPRQSLHSVLVKKPCNLSAARALSSTPTEPSSELKLPAFADEVLRGVGQVVFCNSALSGALIGGGLLYGDPVLGGLAALGCASATAVARMAGYETSAGLMGYNGALVGCGFSVFLGAPGIEPTALATMLGGGASAFVTNRLGKVITACPQWTLSFNFTALAALAYVKPLAGSAPAAAAPLAPAALSAIDWCSSLLTGVSQIFVVNNPVAGALVLAGIAAYSPGAALATLLGSLVGVLMAVAMGADMEEVKNGLWGYNPALTALSVSIFFVPLGAPTLALAVGGSAATVIAAVGMKDLLASTLEVPALTLPFCAVASACYLLNARVPGLVLARAPHSPEVNLKAFRAGA